jgi:hypothetical protein
MDCTRDSIGEVQLDALVDAISGIYSRLDECRTLWDVWSHALHHAAAIAEEIRKFPFSNEGDLKLRQEIADFALWLFTMLGKVRGGLGVPAAGQQPQDWLVRVSVGPSRMMWNRYPGICPWCYCATHSQSDDPNFASDEPIQCCRCDELRMHRGRKDKEEIRARVLRVRSLAATIPERCPLSIDGWQDLVGSIYRGRLSQLSLAEVMLHLFEEMGEVSDGLIRMYTYSPKHPIESEILLNQMRLEGEFADVISWLFGTLERLSMLDQESRQKNQLENPQAVPNREFELSQILWAQYGSDEKRGLQCRVCKQLVCTCPVQFLQSEEAVAGLRGRLQNI